MSRVSLFFKLSIDSVYLSPWFYFQVPMAGKEFQGMQGKLLLASDAVPQNGYVVCCCGECGYT